jgi:hypothetical protein
MAMKRDRERAKAEKKTAKQEKLTEGTEKRREAQDAEAWEGENSLPAEGPPDAVIDKSDDHGR